MAERHLDAAASKAADKESKDKVTNPAADEVERPDWAKIRPSCSHDYKAPTKRKQGHQAIRFRTSLSNTIKDVCLNRGWKCTDSEMDWDFYWSSVGWINEVYDHARFAPWQKINHFRNHRELCRKDLLVKNIYRMIRKLRREKRYEEAALYNISPMTYQLPREYALFVEEFKKAIAEEGKSVSWIMKPIGSSQGKGIFLFRKLTDISRWKSDYRWSTKQSENSVEQYVVQRYVSNPLLIGGKKFDIRIYALVTSYIPLVVYLHRSGFCRFSNSRYSSLTSDMSNQYVHLTNVAIQKTSGDYNKANGGKWDIRELKLHVMTCYGVDAATRLFNDIKDIVVRSLLSVQNVVINDKQCFELYGFDVLIDTDLKPWLIEVNASPSLSANTHEDYIMKSNVLGDMLDVIDIEGKLHGDEEQVGGFDLVYRDGFVTNKHTVLNSYLGCEIPRGKSARRRPPPGRIYVPDIPKKEAKGRGRRASAGSASAHAKAMRRKKSARASSDKRASEKFYSRRRSSGAGEEEE